jgi:hypothetical protein
MLTQQAVSDIFNEKNKIKLEARKQDKTIQNERLHRRSCKSKKATCLRI